jgi:hypothetical protein
VWDTCEPYSFVPPHPGYPCRVEDKGEGVDKDEAEDDARPCMRLRRHEEQIGLGTGGHSADGGSNCAHATEAVEGAHHRLPTHKEQQRGAENIDKRGQRLDARIGGRGDITPPAVPCDLPGTSSSIPMLGLRWLRCGERPCLIRGGFRGWDILTRRRAGFQKSPGTAVTRPGCIALQRVRLRGYGAVSCWPGARRRRPCRARCEGRRRTPARQTLGHDGAMALWVWVGGAEGSVGGVEGAPSTAARRGAARIADRGKT